MQRKKDSNTPSVVMVPRRYNILNIILEEKTWEEQSVGLGEVFEE